MWISSLYKIKIYIKYCYFFHKLLLTLSASKLYIKIFNKSSPILNKIVYQDIQNNGCLIIKLFQWLHSRYTTFYIPNNTNNNSVKNLDSIFDNIFNDIYEKCKIHNLEYSKQLFKQEFSYNFDDIIELDTEYKIKSGSIAQVYKGRLKNTGQKVAIKITHPELYEQTFLPCIYFKIYNILTRNIPYLRKYKIVFELSDFFNSFFKQMNMYNEAKNLKYFYKEYKTNPYILIPKPIIWSSNILIMEYIEAIEFSELENKISDYIKYKIIMLLNLFIKDTMCLQKYYHADLHNGNWKVVDITNSITPSIVIYDFGFCIEKSNTDKILIQNLQKSIETNNILKFAINLYNYIDYNPKSISQDEFIDIILDITKTKILSNNTLYSNEFLLYTINYFIKNNYIFKSKLLDMIIALLLVNNNFKKYLYAHNFDKSNIQNNHFINGYNNTLLINLKSQIMNYINFCKTNKCFYKLQHYLNTYINEIIKKIDTTIDNTIDTTIDTTIDNTIDTTIDNTIYNKNMKQYTNNMFNTSSNIINIEI